MWVKMVDPEANVREEDEQEIEHSNDIPTNNQSLEPQNTEVSANEIVVSHPRRRNHRIKEMKKNSPPMTPSKASNETSSCLVERKL